MTPAIFEITKSATFDAAHRLPGGPVGGPYTRLHGHSFEVQATLRGEARGAVGWVEDLGTLEKALSEVARALDHSLLNDHAGLESPTLEALCLWFAERLKPAFPALARVVVGRTSVGERCSMEVATYSAVASRQAQE